MSTIVISALGPTIGEQAARLGIEPQGMTMQRLDDLNRSLTICHLWGLLTDREIDRARTRLLKCAKFAASATTKGEKG